MGYGDQRDGRGGFRGGRGGGRGGFNNQGPPAEVVAAGTFVSACEGEMVCKLTNPKVPFFNAPIYLQDKTMIGKIDEILGPLNEIFFTVKMQDGHNSNSFKVHDKVYIALDKLLPMDRFLPKAKAAGKASKPTGLQGKVEKKQSSFESGGRGGRGGRGGARGGRGGGRGGARGGSSRGGGRGGFGGGRGGFNSDRGGFNNSRGGGFNSDRGGFNNSRGGGFNSNRGRGGFNSSSQSSNHVTFN
ncbi:MAG: Gar1/Naf1 RNA binding region-domain-containing protein [Benjaminiella poitrasii]|nr:MAG: Gar1/Naf1 RNA binding region-domain-containing protein [Benjaminiella poitrasii]